MKINVNFGNKILVLPQGFAENIDRASKNDIKAFFAVLAESEKPNVDLLELAAKLNMTLQELVASLRFWMEVGIVGLSEQLPKIEDRANAAEANKIVQTDEKENAKKPVRLKKDVELPDYTTEELAEILEKRMETSQLIHECQQTLGKVFNTREINVILGLVDYLALGWEYVIELIGYCARIGKRSVGYVERITYSMIDEGIDNVNALKAKIEELEGVWKNETFVRKLFGMKSRALTAKEKKCIGKWFGTFGYEKDVVSKAYEITVNTTNESSVPYANAIIERWYSEGMKTLEDIERAEAKRREEKKVSDNTEGSFDTDDFFESALQRSYGAIGTDDKK
jgi:DnaD/phage-associated family protein